MSAGGTGGRGTFEVRWRTTLTWLMRALRGFAALGDPTPPEDTGVRCAHGAHQWAREMTTVVPGESSWEEFRCLRCGAWACRRAP